ncbi:hypothetical protein ACRYCC_30670 [Actinomadura scrupuli]|uniref:hypothetical protein n=1 Tax=Actinomadura scrupuli TaxID=559629 RepID=UPI003D97B964
MAWKGVEGDPRIWYSVWDTAANAWGTQIASRFETEHFPTVVQFRNHILMFWNNSKSHDDGEGRICWSELVNGQWTHPLGPGETSKAVLGLPHVDGVTATWNTHEDALFIAYRGPGTVTDVSWWELDNHTQSGSFLWQESGTVPHAAASAAPALVADGNVMYLAWRNVDNDHISWSWSVNGSFWAPPRSLTDRLTSAGPALAALNTSDVVMAWKGGGPDPHIWWSRLRDGVWGEQQAFPDRTVYADRAVSLWSPVLG